MDRCVVGGPHCASYCVAYGGYHGYTSDASPRGGAEYYWVTDVCTAEKAKAGVASGRGGMSGSSYIGDICAA